MMTDRTLPPIPRTRIYEGEEYPRHLVAMYDHIEAFKKVHEYAPSNRELVEAGFASSTSVIRHYLEKMEDFGMLTVTPKISRGIKLIPRHQWKKYATAVPKIMHVMEIPNVQ